HKRIVGVSEEMMDVFYRYNWPGNIREMENLLVRAAVVSQGQVLGKSDFPELKEDAQMEGTAPAPAHAGESIFAAAGKSMTLDEVEEMYIRKVIREGGGKTKGEICEILGISRPTFERKLEKYGITLDQE
ncbi:MAG: helix-turn-helix domain-containing protein, partial [Smithellaceae bacterium]|nr:helix-turn-helix domain-containing protein [Smithellaceae bacterium]